MHGWHQTEKAVVGTSARARALLLTQWNQPNSLHSAGDSDIYMNMASEARFPSNVIKLLRPKGVMLRQLNRLTINPQQSIIVSTYIMRPPQVVVLVPYPAQGHITPMLHLAGALRARTCLHPVLAVPDFTYRRLEPRLVPDAPVKFLSIPSGLGDQGRSSNNDDFFAIDRAMEDYMPPHFERRLRGMELESEVVCVVVDLLASWAIKVADRCGFRTAGFWPAMLPTYLVISAIPKLIKGGFISDCGTPLHNHEHENKEGDEGAHKLVIPVQPKLSTRDLPWLVGNKASQKSRFDFWLRTIGRTETLRWLLVNSFPGPDEENCRHGDPVEHGDHITPQIFQIGPLLANNNNNNNNLVPSMWEEDGSCMQWLQSQPPASVIYVSFGSWVGPVGDEKVAEMAHGLEATKRPFLWVLKDDTAWRSGLPAGFLNRIAGRGKIVGWAPQEAVLSHEAVGCYVTHCGWNSTVEAIRHEKRLVCCPISGDQFVNCNYIVRVWRVGLKLDGFGRDDIEVTVERIMGGKEGEEIQGRMMELKERVMGAEGNSRAEASLHLFMDAIRIRVE